MRKQNELKSNSDSEKKADKDHNFYFIQNLREETEDGLDFKLGGDEET